MDYKNDNRTPRDRITGEFLSELLFTDLGGDSNYSVPAGSQKCFNSSVTQNYGCNSKCRNASRMAATNSHCTAARKDCRESNNDVKIVGDYSLAMAYVQMQRFDDLFDIDKGFLEGTIFKGLRFPFYPTPCRKECN